MRRVREKKQFRLYDIYRCATLQEESFIAGIRAYTVDPAATTVRIFYEDDYKETHYAHNESELKEIVHHVNTRLGNCFKPGVKKGTRRKVRPALNRVWLEYEAEKAKIAATSKDYVEYERRVAELAIKLGI